MTEKWAAGSVGQTDPAAAATEIQDGDDKNSTYSKVKNFTSSAETIENKELVEDKKKRKVHYQNSLLGIIVCCF